MKRIKEKLIKLNHLISIMGLFNIFKLETRPKEIEKNIRNNKYAPKTIILPKKFMKEYLLISDMPHMKEMFSGYKIIEKNCYVTPIETEGKTVAVEENTNIAVMNLNSSNLAGLIIEKDYSCFFVEVFATHTPTKEQLRAGIFLVVLSDKNISKWHETKNKIEIETCGGNGYALCFYDFKERTIKNVIAQQNKKATSHIMTWYLSILSHFLDIFGMSQTSPSNWKPQ